VGGVASVQLPFTLPILSKFGSPLQAKQSSIQISGGKQLSYCGCIVSLVLGLCARRGVSRETNALGQVCTTSTVACRN
jgi:hypothetical protein